MKYLSACMLILLFSTITCATEKSNKPKRLFKGYDGIELYHKQTHSSAYFILSFTNKLFYNQMSVRLDSNELRKLAVNYAALTQPQYEHEAMGEINQDLAVVKIRKRNCIAAIKESYVLTWVDDPFIPDFTKVLLGLSGDSSEATAKEITIENVRKSIVFKGLNGIELTERFSPNGNSFILDFENRDYTSDYVIFEMDSNQVKVLADAYWELTKEKYNNRTSFDISDQLSVTKMNSKYLLGKSDGFTGYTSLSKEEVLIFVNAIRTYFNAPKIQE